MNNKGKTQTLILGFLILMIVVGGIWYFYQREDKETEITIQEQFETKIVYTSAIDQPKDKFVEHCENLGGVFNECGTICAPDVDVCAQVCAYTCEQIPTESEEIDTSTWEEFINGAYQFSLKYPEDEWNNYQDVADELGPKFNFYIKPAGTPLNLPLDHFANVNHVSVYPEGVPTEGVFGQTKDFDFDIGMEVTEDSKIYLLEDGTPFAAYIKPADYPESWAETGFIWISLKIDDLDTDCIRDGEEINYEECEPFSGDQIIRSGSVDEELWKKQKEVVKSFTFFQKSIGGELISLDNLKPGEEIESPFTLKGKVRGYWFFEANFPVILTDWDGRIIAETYAQAQEEWMTEDFVPFGAEIEFDSPYQEGDPDFMKKGNLILQKANPSGLSENNDSLEINIKFK